MGVELALADHQIPLYRTDVGDRYVLEGLKDRGLRLGGEQSGHIIRYDLLRTGDGILAAIQTIQAAYESGKSIEEWHDELSLLPQKIVNLKVANKVALMRDPRVQELLVGWNEELEGAGRVNVRLSGTEPKVRVMVEAPDADERAREYAEAIAVLV
jgi:phosphoglucosamine mutase